MSFISLFFGSALLFVSVLIVGQPWWRHTLPPRRGNKSRTPISTGTLIPVSTAQLESQRDATYTALADLQLDHEMSKINDDDYLAVRAQLMAQAVGVLQQLDAAQADMQTEIDALVRTRRSRKESAGIERPITASNQGDKIEAGQCPACGVPVTAGDRFCARCGTALKIICADCGHAVDADDRFCSKCGATLPEAQAL